MKIKSIVSILIIALILTACSTTNSKTPKNIEQQQTGPITDKNKVNRTEPEVPNEKSVSDTEKTDLEVIDLKVSKDFYVNDVKPEVDYIFDEIDLIWTSLWAKTFKGASDGSINALTGYNNMKTVEVRLDRLYEKISVIPQDKLSKDQKKKIGSFRVELEDAVAFRMEAVKKAKKMFNKEDYSPSTLSEIESLIEQSEEYILNGMKEILELEKEFESTRNE